MKSDQVRPPGVARSRGYRPLGHDGSGLREQLHCIFDGEDECAGLEVGSYEDFGRFRDFVARHLEAGTPGAFFPVLMLHSDCDGEWTPAECVLLDEELEEIGERLKGIPPAAGAPEWQQAVVRRKGLSPRNAYESFIDADGSFLVERLRELARVAVERGRPIAFQ